MQLLFFLHNFAIADDCYSPMVIRKTLPLEGSQNVPLNTKITVSLVGGGDETHMDFTIREHTRNFDIPFTRTDSCYLHESHTQIHCTVTLYPLENLVEYTDYSVVMKGTEFHQEDGFSYMIDFSTGEEIAELDAQGLDLNIMDYVARSPDALDSCDWPDTMKYDLHVEIPDRDTTRNIIIQVYDVDIEECTKTLVHSLFPAPNMRRFDFRQVLEPDDHEDHCYIVVREDWARNTTQRSAVRCWDSELQNDADNHQCMIPLQTINIQETPSQAQTETSQGESTVDTDTAPKTDGCGGGVSLFFLPLLIKRRRKNY